MSSFGNRIAPSTKPPQAAPAYAPPRGIYAGIQCAEARDAIISVGSYRLRLERSEPGNNPGRKGARALKIYARVLDASPGAVSLPDSVVLLLFFETAPGLGELMACVMHAAGFGPPLDERVPLGAAIAEFGKVESSYGGPGSIVAATMGEANGAPSAIGRVVDVEVSRGNPRIDKDTSEPTGEFFNTYRWGVVADTEQAAG